MVRNKNINFTKRFKILFIRKLGYTIKRITGEEWTGSGYYEKLFKYKYFYVYDQEGNCLGEYDEFFDKILNKMAPILLIHLINSIDKKDLQDLKEGLKGLKSDRTNNNNELIEDLPEEFDDEYLKFPKN